MGEDSLEYRIVEVLMAARVVVDSESESEEKKKKDKKHKGKGKEKEKEKIKPTARWVRCAARSTPYS
jgi:hypothetical protein